MMPSLFALHPTTLYSCDNGAIYCGEHCGASARITGRDISGQKVEPLGASTVEAFAKFDLVPCCEECGRKIRTVLVASPVWVVAIYNRGQHLGFCREGDTPLWTGTEQEARAYAKRANTNRSMTGPGYAAEQQVSP